MRGNPALFHEPGRGGVNYLDSVYTLKDFEARDVRNVVSTDRGSIRKRNGSSTLATAPVNLHSLYASQSPLALVGAGGTSLYKITSAGVVSALKTGVTAGAQWEWINAPAKAAQGPVYGFNGTNTPQQWDGAAGSTSDWTAATGTLPNGKYIVYANNRVWAAGMASYTTVADPGSTLVFSNIGDPRDWPVENVVQFAPGDGEAISGIGTVGPYLLVFKPSKSWIVYDLDTGANRPLATNVGCVAHRSIAETPYGTFFLARDQGVMKTDGSGLERVGDRVLPVVETLAQSQRQAASGAYLGDHYYLSISTAGANNDLTIDYDCKQDAWWVHTLAEQDWAAWEPVVSLPRLYGAKGGAPVVEHCFADNVYSDNGDAYESYWSGPFHTLRTPFLKKRLRQIRYDAIGRIDLSLARDFERTASLLASVTPASADGQFGVNDDGTFGTNDGSVFGGGPTFTQQTIFTPGVGRAFSLRFGNASSDPFEVESYTLAITPRRN